MDIYKLLQEDIQSKLKKKKLYSRDCKSLAQQIYDETQCQLSTSTLKRFFGLIKSNFKPSKYTLDTLSVYAGYKDWNDYVKCYDDSKHIASDNDSWNLLKKRMKRVTSFSIESLKQKTNYNNKDFLFRSFVEERFHSLKQTSIPATIFVAPDGYGKSSLMIQLVEKYFLSDGAELKNDIVCLIDGAIFFKLYAKNSNIGLLDQLLEFKMHSSLLRYFQRNPKKRQGRIWLLIDDVDEVFFDKKRYNDLIENIMQIIMVNDDGWFKVLLSCRPENLDVFSYHIMKNPILKSYWMDVNFIYEKYIDAINIPLLNAKEIKSIMKQQHLESKYKAISKHFKDISEIILHPYSCSLFMSELKQNENVSEIVLLNRYIQMKILSPPFLEDKLLLINQYLKLCNRCKETNTVEKELLLSGLGHNLAYQQLIADGVIYEFVLPQDTIDYKVFVSFNQKIILEYMVLRAWRKDRSYSVKLFFEISKFYSNNRPIQCTLLRLFVKNIWHEKEYEVINEIRTKLRKLTLSKEDDSKISECMESVTSLIKDLLETNTDVQKFFRF